MFHATRKPFSGVAIQLRWGQWLKPRPSGSRIGARWGDSARLLHCDVMLSGCRSLGGAGMMGDTTSRTTRARSGSVLASHRESPKPGLPTDEPYSPLSPGM